MTHIEALDLDVLPPHLIVIGGGYAGLELAQAYRRFGAEVTIVEGGPQVMAREDADASHEIRRILANEGVQIHAPAELIRVSGQSGDSVSLVLRSSPASGPSKAATFSSQPGAFRTPQTSGSTRPASNSPTAALSKSTSGWRRRAGRLGPRRLRRQPAVHPHIRGRLPHRSRQSGRGKAQHARQADSPLHAHRPAAGPCGLERARRGARGVKTRIARLPMKAVLRAQATGETEGFMKALVGADDDRILGFTMIGAQAGEVMAVVHTAMMADLPSRNSGKPTSPIRPWPRDWASCSRTRRLGRRNEGEAEFR